jgi:hypothetical protein
MNKNTHLEAALAIMWSLGGILFFFFAASGIFKGTESMQTQITQGLFGICMLICGFYWGNSAGRKSVTADPKDTITIKPQDPIEEIKPEEEK